MPGRGCIGREVSRRYCAYYNYERPHWALDLKTPAEVYLGVSWKDAMEFKQPIQAYTEAA